MQLQEGCELVSTSVEFSIVLKVVILCTAVVGALNPSMTSKG